MALSRSSVAHLRGIAVVALVVALAACSQSVAPPTGPAPNHTLAVRAGTPHPLTFYEGVEDIEPFTPFLAVVSGASVQTMGFAANEGAYYLTTYDSGWNVTAVSNGFTPNDPHFDCDTSPGAAIALAPDRSLMARPCADGSVTVYSLPDALDVYHQDAATDVIPLGARSPVAAFDPRGGLLALTDDGPSGPGQTITLLTTPTWQVARQLSVAAGLLSRPGWSPDGAVIAAVDLTGRLLLWNSATGAPVANGAAPASFALGSADQDPAGPAPQWSPDGHTLYVTTPTAKGAIITAWRLTGATLNPVASATIAFPPDQVNPRLSPDGLNILVTAAPLHGQILTAPDLRQVGDFALPGDLAIWAGNATLDVFTLQATVVALHLGG